ncbi:uncharacterized protein [Pseudorasbora parva]|uniref:uncharacterized protein n=1 Tax=Pseudorasbora parva TaxID=51549 RepID=UPI00351E2812
MINPYWLRPPQQSFTKLKLTQPAASPPQQFIRLYSPAGNKMNLPPLLHHLPLLLHHLPLHFLHLLLLVSSSGVSSRSVSGIKGGNAKLTCAFEDEEISEISLQSKAKDIDICQTEDCSGRVFREGSCDVIIKDLRLRDAGKYFLLIYYRNNQTELKRLVRTYQLHIQDEISVNTGEELKLDLLLTNADKVETNSSGEWTEVWTRGHGVSSDRLTDSDGNLTINAFTSTDTGTYRVLDSEGQILITLTLTESKGKLDTDKLRTNGSKKPTQWLWSLLVVLLACLCFWVWWFSICACLLSSRNINSKGLQIMIFSKRSHNKKL